MTKVNFTESAVAFLDILGFKKFITAAEVTGSNESMRFSQLLDAIGRQLEFNTDDRQEQHKFPKDVGLRTIFISDSLVLSAPINNEARTGYSGLIAVAIKTIQLAHQLLDMGFLLRGGIAVGSVYHTDSNIFGTGYQDAYETESNLAKTPRILLHSSAVERLEDDRHFGWLSGEFSIFMREGRQCILDTLHTHWSYVGNDRNCDFAKRFNRYKTNIECNLSALRQESARSKWECTAKSFNAKLRVSNDLRDVSPIDLDQYFNLDQYSFAFEPVIQQTRTMFGETFGPFTAPRRYVKSFNGSGRN